MRSRCLVEDEICVSRYKGSSATLFAISTTRELSVLILAIAVKLGTRCTNNLDVVVKRGRVQLVLADRQPTHTSGVSDAKDHR